MKIMIVDDSPRIRKLLVKFIDKGNCFAECSNGKEAVKTYSSFLPDWVLMDMAMPEMDGMEASEKIIKEHPSAKILMVTQYDEPEMRQKAKDIGITGYIPKEDLSAVLKYL